MGRSLASDVLHKITLESINNHIESKIKLSDAGGDAALHTGRGRGADNANLHIAASGQERQRLDVADDARASLVAVSCQSLQVLAEDGFPLAIHPQIPVLGDSIRLQDQVSHGTKSEIKSGSIRSRA